MASKICNSLLYYFPIVGSRVPFVGCFESYYCEDFRWLFVPELISLWLRFVDQGNYLIGICVDSFMYVIAFLMDLSIKV